MKQEKSVPSATGTKPSKESKVLTVTVHQDTSKHKVETSDDSPSPKCSCKGKGSAMDSKKKSECEHASLTNNASRLATKQFCGEVEVYNKQSLYPKHSTGFESTSSTQVLLGDMITQRQDQARGMHKQIALILQKNVIMEVPPDTPGFYSNRFLMHKASGGWRPVIDLKHLNTSLSNVYYRLKSEYCKKWRIDLEDVHFHISIHPDSQRYLYFAFINKVYQFQVFPFGLSTAPQVFTRPGSHCGGLPLSSRHLPQ